MSSYLIDDYTDTEVAEETRAVMVAERAARQRLLSEQEQDQPEDSEENYHGTDCD